MDGIQVDIVPVQAHRIASGDDTTGAYRRIIARLSRGDRLAVH